MKRKWVKRFFCVGISAAMLLAPVAAMAEESREVLELPEMTEEDSFIQKHLQYIESDQYKEMLRWEYGLAAELALNYEEAHLNLVNGIWSGFDSTVQLAGSGSLDDTASNAIRMTNEYDIVVAALMEETAAYGNYDSVYTEAYADAAVKMLKDIQSVVKDTKGTVKEIQGKSVKEVSELAEKIDAALYILQGMVGIKDKDRTAILTETMQDIEKQVDEFFKDSKGFLNGANTSLSIAGDVVDLSTAAFSDAMDAYCLYQACMAANQEWTAVWEQIAAYAAGGSDPEGTKLALSINTILQGMEEASEDMLSTMIRESVSSSGEQLARYGVKNGVSMLNEALEKACPLYEAIKTGLVQGVSTANFVTNMDDLAYYGQLMVKTGILSVYARGALSAAERQLRADQDYAAALYFDEVFQIFKRIQLYACDYAIGYKSSITTAPVNYILKHTGDSAAAEIVQLQTLKADISQYSCHRMLTMEETREILTEMGFTNVHVSEKEEYLYRVLTDEESYLGCEIEVDAFSGEARIIDGGELEWEFCNLLSVLNGEKPDLWMSEEEIDQSLTELGYGTIQHFWDQTVGNIDHAATYDYTILSYTVDADRVSGLGKVTFQSGPDCWGYLDLNGRTVLSGDPLPKAEETAEDIYTAALSQEYVEEKIKELIGEWALDEYMLSSETEDTFIYYSNTNVGWSIEVGRLTGLMQQKNYRGVVVGEYQI